MIQNYFKTAWRNLLKNKFYSIINISGLAVSLATALMLLLWVLNEKSFDKFHTNYQNIYKINSKFNIDGKDQTWGNSPAPLAVYSKSIPGIQSIVRINTWDGQVLSDKNQNKNIDGNIIAFTDSSFFDIFSFPLVSGNMKTLFPTINSIVLTEGAAKKIFGNTQAVGKDIFFSKEIFKVTGILKNFPENSSLKYDAIIPMGFYAKKFTEWGGNGEWKTIDEDLGNYNYTIFVKLLPATNPQMVSTSFSNTFISAFSKSQHDNTFRPQFPLQKIEDIHLTGVDGNNSAVKMVNIFVLILILILLIASINYINLTAARSVARMREVSMRKIVGANKSQLFFQFIIETFIIFFWAIFLAIGLVILFMPLYNRISGLHMSFSLMNVKIWTILLATVILAYAASGIYPALILSSFKPIQAFRGKINSFLNINVFRKSLVVLQFAISIVLLIGTIVMSKQMNFIKNKDLGYDKDYVFSVTLPENVKKHKDVVMNEIKNSNGVESICLANAYNIINIWNSSGDISWPGKTPGTNMIISEVCADKDFIPTMKLKLVEGGNFDGTPADSSHFILNEAAVKKMGLKKPYIGQQLVSHGKKGTLIGIVKDFNFKSLKEKIEPLIIYPYNDKNVLYVRTNPSQSKQAITAVEKQYKKYAGATPFTYTFLDESFDRMYKNETRISLLFKIFAGITIFISCMGLFGLATYTAQVKVKEIGIRKTLGATVQNIVSLISIGFLKLVVISIIIALPVAWFVMHKWLQEFEYRTTITWRIFAFAGILALLIAFLTVSIQSVKAAVANPVESLRAE